MGLGAIKYADLSQNRISDYVFDWQKMMAMNGNTATYLQYAYARIQSIFRKGGFTAEAIRDERPAIALSHPAERALGVRLLRLPEVLEFADSRAQAQYPDRLPVRPGQRVQHFLRGVPGLEGRVDRTPRQPAGALRPDRQDLEVWTRAFLESISWNGCEPGWRYGPPSYRPPGGWHDRSKGRSDLHDEHESISALAALSVAGIADASASRSMGPGRLADGGDAPDRSRARATPPGGRRAASLADRAGLSADGTRLLSRQPDLRDACRSSIPRIGRVLHELKTGDKPAGVALSRDGHRGVVTHWYGYDLAMLEIKDDKIALAGRVEVGPEPRGVAMTADGSTAFVAVGVSNEVVRVDLNAQQGHRPAAGRPRAARDRPLARRVATARRQCTVAGRLAHRREELEGLKTIPIDGDNLRQVAISAGRQDRLHRQHEKSAVSRPPGTTSTWAGSSASG